jgi:hypothetical protein
MQGAAATAHFFSDEPTVGERTVLLHAAICDPEERTLLQPAVLPPIRAHTVDDSGYPGGLPCASAVLPEKFTSRGTVAAIGAEAGCCWAFSEDPSRENPR